MTTASVALWCRRKGDVMAKDKTDIVPVAKKQPHPTDVSGCVVCGSYEGELSETAGEARWHKACGERHPAVVAKVKSRA